MKHYTPRVRPPKLTVSGLGLVVSSGELQQRRDQLQREADAFHQQAVQVFSALSDAQKASLAPSLSKWAAWYNEYSAWVDDGHAIADAFAFTTQMESQINTWREQFVYEAQTLSRAFRAAGVALSAPSETFQSTSEGGAFSLPSTSDATSMVKYVAIGGVALLMLVGVVQVKQLLA